MKYVKQAHKPEFFDKSNPLHVSATSGTSPNNEWYAFDSHQDAIDEISKFSSEVFVDGMMIFKGELYSIEDLNFNLDFEPVGVNNYHGKNDYQLAVNLESSF